MPVPPTSAEVDRRAPLLVYIALAVFVLVVLRHAWICDDAFITLRSVRNFVFGQGPRWNLHERVQVFTHPLWFAVLSIGYAITREGYASTLILSIGFSTATAWLLATRAAPNLGAALTALALLASSKSFVD